MNFCRFERPSDLHLANKEPILYCNANRLSAVAGEDFPSVLERISKAPMFMPIAGSFAEEQEIEVFHRFTVN